MSTSPITVSTTVAAPVSKAWKCWTEPEHIIQWNFASADWHCPKATNDLKEGGKFSATMAARDGSVSFDFEGIYQEVIPEQKISYTMADGRKVSVIFESSENRTTVTETFDPEQLNPVEMQKSGWQAILDNYKLHVESVK